MTLGFYQVSGKYVVSGIHKVATDKPCLSAPMNADLNYIWKLTADASSGDSYISDSGFGIMNVVRLEGQ